MTTKKQEVDESNAREQAKAQFENIKALVQKLNDENLSDEEKEQVREDIQQDPLEVSMRSGWANSKSEMEAEEFIILLCTGGPAVRIHGELDRGEPSRAWLEYQDWFTPWTEYFPQDSEGMGDILLQYSQQFYFNE